MSKNKDKQKEKTEEPQVEAFELRETLTKRDQFALSAMSALLTRPRPFYDPFDVADREELAECAYLIADAMIEEGSEDTVTEPEDA